ncbi:MAG: outer membrane protein transport protein, partial [Verrucomicrobiota bacterium]
MNRRNIWRLLAILISGVSAWKASANGFGLPDQDAFATARGEAFVATADNPAAIYYNPAGITQLKGNNLRGGVYGIDLDSSYSPPNSGQTFHSSKKLAAVPQLFYTYTAKDAPLSAGLGVYAPFGGNMNWPQGLDDADFRQAGISGSLKYITINPVIAIKLLPGLSVGGGAMVNYGKISMLLGPEPWASRRVNFFRFTGYGWSAGYNAGILWQPHPKISLGTTFRSSARLNFQGNTDFEFNPGPYNTPALRGASANFTFPMTAVFGISCRPTPKWNIEFDANYTGWNSFDTVNIEESPPVDGNIFKTTMPVNLGWQGSWMYEFGVTRYFDNGWHVSAGYVFNENSVPNQYYTPLAADMDRHFFSIGTGFNGKAFNFDIAYQFGYGPTHTVTGSSPPVPFEKNVATNPVDGKYGFT